MLQVQPLQNQGSISGVTTATPPTLTMAAPQQQPQISNEQPQQQALGYYTDNPNDPTQNVAPLPGDVKSKMVNLLTQAQKQYPGKEEQILNQFIADNQTKYPAQMGKIQSFLGSNDGSRIQRNNNPTAMTTDVAASLGLQEGQDYTQGDPFKSGKSTLYTAKLNSSDPIAATIQAFDKAAQNGTSIFTTSGGKNRWSYINMTNSQWEALTPQQKLATVKHMANVEGGPNGSAMQPSGFKPADILNGLIRDNQPQQNPNSQTSQGLPTLGQELAPEFTKQYWTGLGSNLTDRVGQIGQSIQDTFKGKISPVSGLLQTAGGIAGGLGDVVGKAAEIIPGVKLAEDEIGLGVGALAKTQMGQSVIKSLNDFSTAHPELAGDMNAGFNVITAIPILKGLSVAKNIAFDAISTALKGVAQKAAVNDLTEVLSRTIGGRAALESVPEGLSTLVKNNAIPDLVTEGGITRYSTKDAFGTMSKAISNIDETELQATLAKANVPEVANRIPLKDLRANAIESAKEELKPSGPINEMFDRIQAKYGDYPSLQQVNEAKRTVSKQIAESAWGSPEMNTNKMVRQSLQKGVEDAAQILGLDDVNAINQKMAALIKAQDMLGAIDGKAIKIRGSFLHTAIKGASTAGGAYIGGLFGGVGSIPGAAIGYQASDYLENKLMGFTPKAVENKALQRISKGIVKPNIQRTLGSASTAIGSITAQKINH